MRSDWEDRVEDYWFQGGGECYNFESASGEQVVCHPASKNRDWVKTFDVDTYLCKDCQFEMVMMDKAFVHGRWLYEFECPCCERPFYVRSMAEPDMEGVDRLDAVKQEYAESNVMSEDALELSIEGVVKCD